MQQDNWKIDFYEFDTSRKIKGMAADTNDRINWIEENIVNNYQRLLDSNAEMMEALKNLSKVTSSTNSAFHPANIAAKTLIRNSQPQPTINSHE
jgi:Mg2+ and Co2+ transporter CorA